MDGLSLEPIFAVQNAYELSLEALYRYLSLHNYLCNQFNDSHPDHSDFVSQLLNKFWNQNLHILLKI